MSPSSRLPVLAAAVAVASLSAAAAHAQVASYAIDPTHTFVTFEIPHFATTTNRGRFDKKSGSVSLDKATKTGKVDITVDTSSISTGTPAFDKHLQSKDFFNVAEFPTARFVADRMVFGGDKVAEVPGQLTLLGKTNPVTFKAMNFNCYQHSMLKREVCGGDFETTIQRSQWGMGYGIPNGFADNVRLVVQVEAIVQQ